MESGVIQGEHFSEKGFRSHAAALSDGDYGIILDNIVVACVDIVIMKNALELLLGKRVSYPFPGWWVIGGRMLPGENFQQSASRIVLREVELGISPARFQYLCTYSLAWAKRAQPPRENGSHNVSITMIVKLRSREVPLINTRPEEYEALKWVKLHEIKSNSFHPALIMLTKNIKTVLEQSGK